VTLTTITISITMFLPSRLSRVFLVSLAVFIIFVSLFNDVLLHPGKSLADSSRKKQQQQPWRQTRQEVWIDNAVHQVGPVQISHAFVSYASMDLVLLTPDSFDKITPPIRGECGWPAPATVNPDQSPPCPGCSRAATLDQVPFVGGTIDNTKLPLCSESTFPYPTNGTQCMGLAQVQGVDFAEECLAACCSRPYCSTWQFDPHSGCFVGDHLGVGYCSTKTPGRWEHGGQRHSRAPPTLSFSDADTEWHVLASHARTEGGLYGSAQVHLCPIPRYVGQLLLSQGQEAGDNRLCLDVKVRFQGSSEVGVVPACSHSVRPIPSGDTKLMEVVEGHAAVYFPAQRSPTDNSTSMLALVIPWIDFHLHHGVDQIYAHVNLGIKSEHLEEATMIQFWKDLYRPYWESGEVVLVFHRNRNVLGDAYGWQRQGGDNAATLWLSKQRAQWFGTHDLDEYVMPDPAGVWDYHPDNHTNSSSIATILSQVPHNCLILTTPMHAVRIPGPTAEENHPLFLAQTHVHQKVMPVFHKYYARVDEAQLPWVHSVSDWSPYWRSPQPCEQHRSNNVLRINHYKSSGSKFVTEDPKMLHNFSGPMTHEHRTAQERIRRRYGTSHREFLIDLCDRYETVLPFLQQEVAFL